MDFYNILLIFMEIGLFLSNQSNCAVLTWIGNQNARTEVERSDCTGLIYDEEENFVTSSLDSCTIAKIVFPLNGAILLNDGANITFDSKSTKCTEVKINDEYDFYKSSNWYPPIVNRATPSFARRPCQWDDIVIPKSNTFGMEAHYLPIYVKSITIFGRKVTEVELEEYKQGHNGDSFDVDFKIVPNTTCTRETCFCQYDNLFDVCQGLEPVYEVHCKYPIKPRGFCDSICGAIIHIHKDNKLKDEILKLLQEAETSVDFYYGLDPFPEWNNWYEDGEHVGQIVIVDKDAETGGREMHKVVDKIQVLIVSFKDIIFTRKKDFDSYDEVLNKINEITIITSGTPIILGSFWSSTFGILLMTLFVNVLIFLAIYVFFVTPLRHFDLRTFRMNPSTFRPFLFARFDNANDLSDADDDEDNTDTKRRVDISFRSSKQNESTSSSSSNVQFVQKQQNGEGQDELERYKVHEDCAFDNPLYGQQIDQSCKRKLELQIETTRAEKEKEKKEKYFINKSFDENGEPQQELTNLGDDSATTNSLKASAIAQDVEEETNTFKFHDEMMQDVSLLDEKF